MMRSSIVGTPGRNVTRSASISSSISPGSNCGTRIIVARSHIGPNTASPPPLEWKSGTALIQHSPMRPRTAVKRALFTMPRW